MNRGRGTKLYNRTQTNTCLKCDCEFDVIIIWQCQDDYNMKRICPTCKAENKLVHEEDYSVCEYIGKNSLKNKKAAMNTIKTIQGF